MMLKEKCFENEGFSITETLGIFGITHLDPIILAFLANESPALLIGAPGTAKTLMFERLANVLGLRFKHYNASQVTIDDLIGFPINQDGEIRYSPTPASCWDAQALFIDEISRCKPEVQNKLFALIYEKKLIGIPLDNLRFRWAAMNPPQFEEDVDTPESYICTGSFPLDAALADRFHYLVKFPYFYELSRTARRKIILSGSLDPGALRSWFQFNLNRAIEMARNEVTAIKEVYGRAMAEFVEILADELMKKGLEITSRRAKVIFENMAWVLSATKVLSRRGENSDDLFEAVNLVVLNSLPHRAFMKVNDDEVEALVKRAYLLSKMPANVTRTILLEPNPINRIFLALKNASEIEDTMLSQLIEDGVNKLPIWDKMCFVLAGYRTIANFKISAAVADQLSLYFQEYSYIKRSNKKKSCRDPMAVLFGGSFSTDSDILRELFSEKNVSLPDRKIISHIVSYLDIEYQENTGELPGTEELCRKVCTTYLNYKEEFLSIENTIKREVKYEPITEK